MSKKTESFFGMTKRLGDTFAKTSLADARKSGKQAAKALDGVSLARRSLDLTDKKSRIEAANSLKERVVVLMAMGECDNEVWPLLMGAMALEREL